jgi:LCP family protein required for cell wall assembly
VFVGGTARRFAEAIELGRGGSHPTGRAEDQTMDGRACPGCGATVSSRDRYCPDCGKTIPLVTDGERADRTGEQPRRRLIAALRRPESPALALASATVGTTAAAGGPAPSAAGHAVRAATAETPGADQARPRWYRRPRVAVPLVMLVLLAFATGAVGLSIHRTFATLHQVSTPPPELSGAVLGGDDSVVIDTGPAKSAVAAADTATATATRTPQSTATAMAAVTATAQATMRPSATTTDALEPTDAPATTAPTRTSQSAQLPPPPASTASTEEATHTVAPPSPTPTPTPAASAEPSSTATAEPTATPTELPAATATNAVPTAQPTATPVLSQIERIKNGSFEAGNDQWYLEAGAGAEETAAVSGSHALVLPTTGAWADQGVFFLNGTTYELSAWGKVGAKGGIGQIGVTYTDANGERLTDLEPAPLPFAATTYEQQTLSFTVPDGVAIVKVFAWNSSSKGGFVVDNLSLRSVVAASSVKPAKAASDDGAITILVMGVDARPGEPIDIGVRPDSLMVVRLDPVTGSCRTLSIPRDTRTELPGYGQSKINHALAVGGIPYEQQVVENLLGLKIDHYLLIDFNGFEDLVDAVGGIKIDVPDAFSVSDDISFAAGVQTMDGKHALAYARYRGGPDGDFGRIARQQQVLRALLKKGASLNVVRSLNELLPAVEDNLRTDLDPSEMARLGLDYRDTCTDDSVEMLHLEGYDAWFEDPLLQMQLEYVVVDEAEVRSKVAMLEER